MYVDWTEVNERRIGEKTQEIHLYCAQKKELMTERAFDLARLSLVRLMNNITERNSRSSSVCKAIQQSMDNQDDCIAYCTENQAAVLARGVVYNCIGDDLNLYPITAEKKLLRAKLRDLPACDIPKDEMTVKDFIYIASAIAEGENISTATMRSVFEWFRDIGLDPYETRIFSVMFMKQKPMSLKSIPSQNLFATEYSTAAKSLVNKGFISELPGGKYCLTEIRIE